MAILGLFLFSNCSGDDAYHRIDSLNMQSYYWHYRNIDSTEYYASKALNESASYNDGRAEALNNLAFVNIIRMNYADARRQLNEAVQITDNQVELLIAYIQQMRLCQRMSDNREFYAFRERAMNCLRRINEERDMLSPRLQQRMIYADSEYAIVCSTYFYYVGLEDKSREALNEIDPNGAVSNDTAQLLNYLYNVGAGGIITNGSAVEIQQQEFDCLVRCLQIAGQHGYTYFIANSLEALSEHLMVADVRNRLIAVNPPAIRMINPDGVSDSLLAGNLAERSLWLFQEFGDVYQISGAYRTLASCYHSIGDYETALYNLNLALSDDKINQAPDLVASIREQMSVAYSAMNNKEASDISRNIYLDLQEQTRQDRYLEARAAMYDETSMQLNLMIAAVMGAIILLVLSLWLFQRLGRRGRDGHSLDHLLIPLRQWKEENGHQMAELEERYDEIQEHRAVSQLHIRNQRRLNIENRAKISLVNSITPLIDRMKHCIDNQRFSHDAAQLDYVRELTDKINEQNDILTHWIQLRQGELNIHVESFPLQTVFDIVARSKMSFSLKGISLDVQPTSSIVKADRILTLFMINTLADNSRKFSKAGGRVTIRSNETDGFVEISVADDGRGMSADELNRIFSIERMAQTGSGGHGFGLLNCRGIIEKYKKVSQIFSVCTIGAESKEGIGSRFFFRLPKGMRRALLLIVVLASHLISIHSQTFTAKARQFADSAYLSNLNGTYERTLVFADSCRFYLNRHYRQHVKGGIDLMVGEGDTELLASEIKWFHDSLKIDYQVILDIRNESAVAALALHKWQLYTYNNKVYTQLFKELSADDTLAGYCRMMSRSQTNKTIAVIILVIMLILIPPGYYLLYYRHRLYYRFCVERIKTVNEILLGDSSARQKLSQIEPLTHEEYPDELQRVVEEIVRTLNDSIKLREQKDVNMELAEDELRRAEYEVNMLHVSNSVLDNCLSTLKHETMYYPSRIRQLVDEHSVNMDALREIVAYYRDLYCLLSQQAMRQIERIKIHIGSINNGILGDAEMLGYMKEILLREGGGAERDVRIEAVDTQRSDGARYAEMIVPMPRLSLTAEELATLFTPKPQNIPYLICRQIVREHGEATNRRGCGIAAGREGRLVVIRIILPRSNK